MIAMYDDKVLSDIEEYGWHVVKVMEDNSGPGFCYSIGLFKTFGHPEIMIVERLGFKDIKDLSD